ncbi:NAD(P)H-dependent oxidoreductase [Xanthobacter dioxanivorans]|uniref:NAD(P)H-dependent oxidoreductase n=1 Tax=Xanthobacter dioxanivorans TaxID=2528964 RepID=A0A974PK22_9HYPH|nr:NAD(P)H-dependent oxidoreductase [Xanthobacter dioxanivorans]QRG04651.1 NAD(P)H-dependent oxidoreductase [Xanthobacter dioxanivorans]
MIGHPKYIMGIGGTLRINSSTELAVRRVLKHASDLGAKTEMFAGADLAFPFYDPSAALPAAASPLISALRRADAVVIGSPGYHGSVSGLIKNALDYVEATAGDALPYFTGRPVACLATGAGWQGANTTLGVLRSIVHALRGWPTPLGAALNSQVKLFTVEGECLLPEVDSQLQIMAGQLMEFQGAPRAPLPAPAKGGSVMA